MAEVMNCEPVPIRETWTARLKTWIRLGISLLRWRSFDTATTEGRSQERYRRVLITAISTAAARGTSLLTILISVPLIVHHFGSERYALWATITSTVTLLVFADFGIGSGLLNAISESHGTGDRESAVSYVSTGFFVLLAVALIGAIAFYVGYPFIPWRRVFNLNSPIAIREAGPAAAVFVVCFLAQLPLGVVQRVQLGYQEGFITQIWATAGNMLGLLGLLWVIHVRAGLPWPILAIAGAPALTGLMNTVIHFAIQRPWPRPRLDRVARKTAGHILELGFLFFVLQVTGTIGYQTDNLILAQILSPASVTTYAVTNRLFMIVPSILFLIMVPLWPAYGEAAARGDVHWIKKTLGRSLLVALSLTIPTNLVLLAFTRPIIRLWVGPQIVPSMLLLVSLATWTIISNGVSVPVAMFCNGVGFIRVQAICSVFMAVSNVLLSIYLTRRIGISGVVFGSIASQLIFIGIPFSIYMPRWLASLGAGRRVHGGEIALGDY